MKKSLAKITILLTIITFFNSCGILMNQEITCRKFSFSNEHYWFPQKIGDTLSYTNQYGDKKLFQVVDKRIYHRDKYISDTGCGCLDYSQMLITNYVDSIWFAKKTKYIYDNDANHYEEIGMYFENSKNFFNQTSLDTTMTLVINGTTFHDVQVYSNDIDNKPRNIKVMYRAKNIGIIQYVTHDGEIWTLSNFRHPKLIDINNFRYKTTYCGYNWMLGGFYSKTPPKTIVRPAQ